MSVGTTFIIHMGGQMGLGPSGFQYDMSNRSCISRRLKIKTKPTFAELMHKISARLALSIDERICRVVYKCPTSNQGSPFWTGMVLNDDNDIDEIYENLDRYAWYTLVELIVETEKVNVRNNPEMEIFVSQVTNEFNIVERSQCVDLNEIPLEDANPISMNLNPIHDSYETFQPNLPSSSNSGGQNNEGGDGVPNEHQRASNEYVDPNCDPDGDDQDIDEDNELTNANDGDNHPEEPVCPITVSQNLQHLNMHDQHVNQAAESNISDFHFPSVHHTMVNFEAAELDMSNNAPLIRWDGVSELSIGLAFTSKDDLQSCVKKYHILYNVEYFVYESRPTFWVAKCTRGDQGCKWKLRGAKKSSSPYWFITVYKGPHTCKAPMNKQQHRQLDSQIICDCILEMVSANPALKVSVIMGSIKNRFNYNVPYNTAWYAKTKALEEIFGKYEESYAKLPCYLQAMQLYNPGTVFDFVVEESHIPYCKQFKRVFWSFKPCINGFPYYKPVIQIK